MRTLFFSRILFRLLLDIKVFFRSTLRRFFKKGESFRFQFDKPLIIKDSFNRFFKQAVATATALLFVTSFAPTGILNTGFTADNFEFDTDFSVEEEEDIPPFILNEEGFVLKTDEPASNYTSPFFTDSILHTVASGENCSGIAALYGIKTTTLLWENNLPDYCPLKVGQTLVILPQDGVHHMVAKGETLAGISKSYGIDEKLIREYNGEAALTKGQKLFIPGGKRKEPIIARGSLRGGSRWTGNTFDTKLIMGSNASPKGGKSCIFPTTGQITQGFRRGHYAVDIANPSKPDIWACTDGTVLVAKGGCPPVALRDKKCNGGRGNYVVIDHGQGLVTEYYHFDTIYVTEGQSVTRGQAIGRMGSSGRVYGQTGIHLHFIGIRNGEVVNPATLW